MFIFEFFCLLATPVAIFMIFYALWQWLSWKLSMLISQFWWLVGYQGATGNGYLSFGCNQPHNHDQRSGAPSIDPPFVLHRSLKGNSAIQILFWSCSLSLAFCQIPTPSSSPSPSSHFLSGPWQIPSSSHWCSMPGYAPFWLGNCHGRAGRNPTDVNIFFSR